MNIRVNVTVTDRSIRCSACGTTILERNWCLKVAVGGKNILIHDNEGICLSKLKVSMHIIEPNFLSSRPVGV